MALFPFSQQIPVSATGSPIALPGSPVSFLLLGYMDTLGHFGRIALILLPKCMIDS